MIKNCISARMGLIGLLLLCCTFSLSPATNLALNRNVVTSTNFNAAYSGAKAVDGITSASSKWTSNGSSAGSWMYVDLGSTKSISRVVVKHAGAAGELASYNTTSFRIAVYNNGWITKANVTSNTSSVTTHTFSANTRYVLLQIYDAGIDNYARIPEFEVHDGGNCAVSIVPGGTSSLGWPHKYSQFTSRTCGPVSSGCGTNGWRVTCSSGCYLHVGDDYYADDWIRYNNQGTNVSCGEDFHAPLSGTVLYAGRLGYSYGRTIIIRSSANNNFAFRVAHLQSIASGITANTTVSVGQYLGKVGNDDGTNNGETTTFPCHTHCVLYKNIGNNTALSYLRGGHAPSGSVSGSGASNYAAPYYLDAAGCSNKQGAAVDAADLEAALRAETRNLHRLEVFPNPVKGGQTTLAWEQGSAAQLDIRIMNMMGQTTAVLAEDKPFSAGEQQFPLDLSGIASGLYLVVVRGEGGTLLKKITIE